MATGLPTGEWDVDLSGRHSIVRSPLPAPAELEACFVVLDSAGQKLAYVYYEEEAWPAISGEVADEG
jgi:hypothetical protein